MRGDSCVPLILTAVLAVVGGTPVRAQAVAKPDRAAPLRELFQELDSNGDRVVSPDEVPERGKDAFRTLLKQGDKDRDGKLTAEEYRGLLQASARAVPAVANPEQRRKRFDKLDANNDGKLDAKEMSGGPSRLQQLDRDRDGTVSREEFLATAPIRPAKAGKPRTQGQAARPLLQRLKAMDRDGDSRISRQEFTGRPAAFDRLDANHDGFLDREDDANRPAGQGKGTKARPKAKS